MCEKREKRLDRSLPRSPRTRSASPPDARASPHAATWPVSGINSQLLREGLVRHRKVVSRQKLTNVGRWLTANQFFCGHRFFFGGPFLVRLELPQLRR